MLLILHSPLTGTLRSGFFSLLLLSTFNASAEQLHFMVTDEMGKPLSDVVIEPGRPMATADESGPVAVIDQVNKRFVPEQLIINAGQSVDFPNSDNIRHHVYSFSEAKTFELKLYADTPEHPINFPRHGVVVLGCNIHDTMIAYIYVSESDQTVMTDETGQATIQSQSAISHVNVWHKHQARGPETIQSLDLTQLQRDTSGRFSIRIETVEPAPTGSFEDTFGEVSSAD